MHLKYLLEDEHHQTTVEDIRRYTNQIYFKQKSLPIYPEGEEHDLALSRIKSNQICLQYAIEEYDEWYAEVTQYIDENMFKFEYYHGYQTGDRSYPPMSFEIIDNTVRSGYIMRNGVWNN